MPNNFNLIDILNSQTAQNAREYSQEYDDFSGMPSVSRQVDLVEREKSVPLFRSTSRENRAAYQARDDYSRIPVDTIARQDNLKESDRDNVWTSYVDQINLEDRRASQQSGAEQLVNGVTKGVVIAGTTFLDGVVGSAAGIVNLAFQAAKGDIERPKDALFAFIDNPVSKALQKVNDAAEKAIPNYYSNEQRESPWYAPVNLFSANFVGDKFLKNLGFMLGAAYSGKVNANVASRAFAKKELRDAFKGVVVTSASTGDTLTGASEIYKAFKTGDALADGIKMTEHLGKQAKQLINQEWGLKLLGAVTSAAGEARIEAITNTEDYTKRMQAKLDDERRATLSEVEDQVIALNTIENPTYVLREDRETGRSYPVFTPLGNKLISEKVAQIEQKYQQACNQLQQDRAFMANQIFGLNMFILSGTNLYTFGRFMAGGYKTSSKIGGLVKGGIKEGHRESNRQFLKDVAKTVGVPLSEGPYEEMMQSAVATGAGYRASARMNKFYGYAIDEEAQDDAVNSVNAILQGIRDTYTDANKWEEGAIGGLSSIVGIPGFVETRNKDGIVQYDEYKDENGETRYKAKKHFRMQGEFWDSIRDAIEDKGKSKELVEELNRITKDPKFIERWQSYIRHKNLDKLMSDRLDHGDIFGYKNAESDQIISDILAFEKAGRIRDLFDMIEESEHLTADDGETIKKQTADEDTGISPYGDMSGQEVADAISKHATEFRKILEKYQSVKDDIRQVYGKDMDSKYLDALTWGYMSIENAEDRIKDLSEKLIPKLNDIFHIYSAVSGIDLNINVDNLRDLFKFSMSDADRRKFSNAVNKAGSIKNLSTDKILERMSDLLSVKNDILDVMEATDKTASESERKQLTAQHDTVLDQYLRTLELLALVDADQTLHPVSDAEMTQTLTDLADIGSLIKYRSDFFDMLAVLTNNPGAFEKSVIALNKEMINKNNEREAQQVYDSIPKDIDQKAFNDLIINRFKNSEQRDIFENKVASSTDSRIKELYKNYEDFINAYAELFNNVRISDDDPLRGVKSALLNRLDERINNEAAASKEELISYLREEAERLGFQEAIDYAEELINKINVAEERKNDGDNMIKNNEPSRQPTADDKKAEKKQKKEKKAKEKKAEETPTPEVPEQSTMFDKDGSFNEEYDRPTGLSQRAEQPLDDESNNDLLTAEETIKKLSTQDLIAIVEGNLIPESLLGKIEIKQIIELAKFYLEEADAESQNETAFADVIRYKDKEENDKASPEKTVSGQKVFDYPEGTLLKGISVTKYNIDSLKEDNTLHPYDSDLGLTLDQEFNVYGFLDSGALAKIEQYQIDHGDRAQLHFAFANKNEGAKYEGKLHTIQNEGQENQHDNYNILLALEMTDELINCLSKEQQAQMKLVNIGDKRYQIVGSISPIKNSYNSKNAYDMIYTRCIDSIDRQRESASSENQDLFIGDSNGQPVYTTIAKIYTGRLQKVISGDKYKPINELLDTKYQKDIYFGAAIKSKKYGTISIYTPGAIKTPEALGIPAVPGMVYAFIPAPDGSTTYVPVVMARSNEIDWSAENTFTTPIHQNVDTLLSSNATSQQKYEAKMNIMHQFGQPFQLYYRLEDPTSFKFIGNKITSWEEFVEVMMKPSTALRVQFGIYTGRDPDRLKILLDNGLMRTRYQSLQHYNASFLVWGLDSKTGKSKKVKQRNISEIQHNVVKDTELYVVQYGDKQYHINSDNEIVDDDNVPVDNALGKRILVQLSVAHAEDEEDFGLNIKRETGKTMKLYTIQGAADGSYNTFYMARNVKSKVVKEISESDAKMLHDMIERENQVEEAKRTIDEAREKGFDISHGPKDTRIPANPEKLTDEDFKHTVPEHKEEKKEEEKPEETKGKKRRQQTFAKESIGDDLLLSDDPTDEDMALLPIIREYGINEIQSYLQSRGYGFPSQILDGDISDIVVAQVLNKILEESNDVNRITKDDLEHDLHCGRYGS